MSREDRRTKEQAVTRSEAAQDSPLRINETWIGDGLRGARVVIGKGDRPFRLRLKRKGRKRDRHARTRVAFFRYSYYNLAFKYFTEQALDAEYVELPAPTRRTHELGARYSTDFVCAPFKHILGDYIEALELGADVLVQFTGPCRLGYYGELQESILRDLGYEFEMLNFATVQGKAATEYVKICKKKVNPDLSIPNGVRQLLVAMKMIEHLDTFNDYYLANAGFEDNPGDFARARQAYYDDMACASTSEDVEAAQRRGMQALRDIPLHKPADPLRVGVVGEYFTAPIPDGNLHLEDKLMAMGVEVHRMVNMTHRNLHYNEENLRAGISEYVSYDMGPTSTMTLAATHKYAQQGFDGVVHVKSTGCTPEIDCVPVLQRISADTGMPVLCLSFDLQTSDTGLNTRLEAFYDMIAMKKRKTA